MRGIKFATALSLPIAAMLTSASAIACQQHRPSYAPQPADVNFVIERRAAELHWQQSCGGCNMLDIGAARAISNAPNGSDRLLHELTRLRSKADVKRTCAMIQKKFDLKK